MKVVEKEINPLWEAVKEPLRLLVLAIVPFGIAYLTELPYEWAATVTVFLRFLDKYLHEIFKAEGSDKKGILPF